MTSRLVGFVLLLISALHVQCANGTASSSRKLLQRPGAPPAVSPPAPPAQGGGGAASDVYGAAVTNNPILPLCDPRNRRYCVSIMGGVGESKGCRSCYLFSTIICFATTLNQAAACTLTIN
jgi:hypothetical protein